MRLDSDVIVVGAGPAGTAGAIACARLGLRVIVLDKARFPRPKVCGCCLSARACSILRDMADEGLVRKGVPLRTLVLRSESARVRIPLDAGVALSRDHLDAALVEAARAAGAEVIEGARAVGLGVHDEHAEVSVRICGTEAVVRARVVICAEGLSQSLTRSCAHIDCRVRSDGRIGVGARLSAADIPAGEVVMCVAESGYAGLVRLEDGTVDLACALDPRAIRAAGGPQPLIAGILEVCGVRAELAGAVFRGTPILTRTPTAMGARRAFLVGDAGGYVEPISGEGITWALASGRGVAPVVRRACDGWDDRLVRVWTRRHHALVGRRRTACRAFAWGLRHEWARRSGLGLLSHLPTLRPVVTRPFAHEGRP